MIELVLIFIITIFDAYRDGQSKKKPGVSSVQWHIPKWIAFYTPQIYFTVKVYPMIGLKGLAFLTLINWALWKFIYETIRKYWNEK